MHKTREDICVWQKEEEDNQEAGALSGYRNGKSHIPVTKGAIRGDMTRPKAG